MTLIDTRDPEANLSSRVNIVDAGPGSAGDYPEVTGKDDLLDTRSPTLNKASRDNIV